MVKRGGSDKRISDRSFYWEIIVSFVIVLLIVLTIYSSIYYSFTGAATADKIFSYNINKIFKTSEKLDLILEGPPATLTITGSFSGPSFVHITAKDRLGNNSYTILDSNNLSNLGVITITSPVPSSENEQKNATNKTDQKANQKTIIRDLKYYCRETCSNLNLSNRIELIIDVNGTFELDKISYETSLEKKPPVIIKDNLSIDAEEGNSIEINLLDYFNDPNGDNVVFSFRPIADADIRIVKNTMRIVPLKLGEIGIEVVATDFTSVQKAVFQIISSERMQKIYAENFKVVVSDRYSKKEGVSDIEKRDDGKLNINISLEDNRIELFGAEFDETYVNMTENDLVVKVGRIDDDRFGTKAVSVSGLQSLENSRIVLKKINGKSISEILKCDEFDEDLFRCEGVWKESNLPFEETEKEVIFYAEHFSGYVGADIEVINIQSYPPLGGNWTVRFRTNGTANLTITGINGTDFTEIPDDNSTQNDLKFLSLTCNNQSVPYQLNMSGSQLKSVASNNYNCSGEGRFASKVLTAKKHYLEFRYGDKIRYAKNDVLTCAANITASGKTTLTAHLTGIPCAGFGVTIVANNVELDCAHYDINGSNVNSGVIVKTNSTTATGRNITVKNCDISGFHAGILFQNVFTQFRTQNATFFNNTINKVRTGIDFLNTSSTPANHTRFNFTKNRINTTLSNKARAIVVGSASGMDTNITVGTIHNNTIETTKNYSYGIVLNGTLSKINVTFNKLRIESRNSIGINSSGGSKSFINFRNNTILINATFTDGMQISGKRTNITGNKINITNAATGYPIQFLKKANDTKIYYNRFVGTGLFGIYLASGNISNLTVVGNFFNATGTSPTMAAISVDVLNNLRIINNTIVTGDPGYVSSIARIENATIKGNRINTTRSSADGLVLRNLRNGLIKNNVIITRASLADAISVGGHNVSIRNNNASPFGYFILSVPTAGVTFENSTVYNNSVRLSAASATGIFGGGSSGKRVRNISFIDLRANATRGGASIIGFTAAFNISVKNANFSNLSRALNIAGKSSRVNFNNSVMSPAMTITAGSRVNFTNSTLENQNGQIRFSQASVNDSVTATSITINNNFINIPTKTIPDMDTKANLTFRNVPYGVITGTATLFRNGSLCRFGICTTFVKNATTNQAEVQVNRFSNYSVNGTITTCGGPYSRSINITARINGSSGGRKGCINITGSDMFVRCNPGPVTNGSLFGNGSGIAIRLSNASNVSIINCTFTRWTTAIYAINRSANNSFIENNFTNNTAGIYANASNNNNATRNIFRRNNIDIVLNKSSANKIRNNTFRNSTFASIVINTTSLSNLIRRNTFYGSAIGIFIDKTSATNNILRNSFENGSTQIKIINGTKNNMSYNNLSDSRASSIEIGSLTKRATSGNFVFNNSIKARKDSIKVINDFKNNISNQTFPKNATFINTSFGNLTFTNRTRWSQTYRRIIDIINMSLNLTTVRADKETGLNTSAHLQFARIPFTGGAVFDATNNRTFSNCTTTRCSKVTQTGTLVQYDARNFTQYSNKRNVTGTGAGTSGGTTPQSGGGGKGYNPIYTTAARTLPQCNELWACGEWTVCENERQERICRDVNKCGTFLKMPELSRECEQISVPEAIVMKLSKTNSWWLFWVIAVLALSSIAVLLVSMNLKRKKYAQEYENAYGVDKKRFGIMHKFGLGIANTAQSIKNVCGKIAGSPAISRERDKILTETEIGAFRFEGIFKAIVNAVAGRSIMNYKRYLFLNKSEYRVAGTEKMMKEVNKVMSHKFVPRKDDFSGKIFSVDRTIYNEDVQFSRHDKKSDKAFYGKRRNNPLKSLLSILSIRKGIFPFVLIFLILSSALILQYLTYTGAVTFEKSYSKIIYRQFSQDDTDNVLNFALEGPPVTLTITGSLIGPSSRALIYLEDQFSNRSYVIMNSSALKKPDLIETNASSLVLEEIENNSENLTSGKGFILKSFSRYCLETCGKINTTQKIRIVVKVLNGSIDLTRIDYKAERRPLPPQIVRGNLELLVYSKSPSEINLSSYFNDPNNDKLIYIVGRDESLNPKIIGEVLKITPAETGSKKLRVIATDLTYRRNLEFDINVQDYLNRIVKIDMDEFELAFEDKYGREIGTKEIKENADGTLDINLSFEKKLLSSEAGGNIEINGAKFDSNEITKTDVDVIAKIDEIDEINSTVTTISTKVASIEGIGKFESAILTLPKLNNKTVNVILRCDNFDNEFFVCNSEWKIANVPFKQTEDSVIIYADHFSGYAGGYIDILNVQSYPVLHGNWTVRFKTNGTNNLTITATNGTTFTEVPIDDSSTENDLQFLDLRCGSSPVSFIENISGRQLKSIRSVDYNCSQEGSFTSKVLTSEKHYLEFNFGNTTKIAKNDVLGCGVVLSSANTTTNVSIQINGTQKKWTNCINVTASNIKIQCVSGGSGRGRFVGNGSGTAISLSNATNVTVRNCTFTNWTTGVYLFNHSFNNTITKNNFTSNNYSILTLRSNLTSILNNSFRYNGIDILLNRSSRDIIANNTLRNATNNSINFVGTKVARTIIKKNIFNQSTRSIVYGQSDNISIINNSFFNAGIDAISVESHRSNISWNIFDDTKDDHIDLVGMWAFIYRNSFKDISGGSFASAITFCVDSRYCGNSRIRNNTFRDYNTDPVIYISSLSNVSIMGNEIDLLGNTGQGIRFNSVRNSTIANNTFNTTFTAIQADGDGGDNKLLDNNLVQVQNGYIITHNNEIIKNNRVVVAFANGYGVSVSSGVNNAQIINNTILSRGTPSNTRGVIVQNSRNISIRNNTIENFTGAGIDIYTTNNSKINKNQINRSKQGIRLSSTSNFNNITLNRVQNGNISILLLNASKNNITKNNFTNATLVAIIFGSPDSKMQGGITLNQMADKNYISNNTIKGPRKSLWTVNSMNNNISKQFLPNGTSFMNETYGEVNFTQNINWSATRRKINNIIMIDKNIISVNTTAEANLNRNATLRFFTGAGTLKIYNSSSTNGRFERCLAPRCGGLVTSGTTKGYNVTKWTTYALGTINISIAKTVSTALPIMGDYMTYRINITNNANHTQNFTIEDLLPAGVTYISSVPNATLNNRELTFPLKNVSSRKSYIANITVNVTGNHGTNHTNFANVTVYNGTANRTINTTVNISIQPRIVTTLASDLGGSGGKGFDPKFTTAVRDISDIPSMFENNIKCNELWLCGEWEECMDNVQIRTCNDLNKCKTFTELPEIQRECGNETAPDETIIGKIRQIPKLLTKSNTIEAKLSLLFFALLVIFLIIVSVQKLHLPEKIEMLKEGFRLKMAKKSEMEISAIDTVMETYDWKKIKEIKKKKIPVPNAKAIIERAKPYEEKVRDIDEEIRGEERRLRKLRL